MKNDHDLIIFYTLCKSSERVFFYSSLNGKLFEIVRLHLFIIFVLKPLKSTSVKSYTPNEYSYFSKGENQKNMLLSCLSEWL